jgi:hypothetical protein
VARMHKVRPQKLPHECQRGGRHTEAGTKEVLPAQQDPDGP